MKIKTYSKVKSWWKDSFLCVPLCVLVCVCINESWIMTKGDREKQWRNGRRKQRQPAHYGLVMRCVLTLGGCVCRGCVRARRLTCRMRNLWNMREQSLPAWAISSPTCPATSPSYGLASCMMVCGSKQLVAFSAEIKANRVTVERRETEWIEGSDGDKQTAAH